MFNNVYAVILAAGKGSRMADQTKPKVLQTVARRPLLFYILKTLKQILPLKNIYLVVGFNGEQIVKKFGPDYHYVWQKKQKGTAHAAYLALKKIPSSCEQVLIFNGDDSLFLAAKTIINGLQKHLSHANLFSLAYCSFPLKKAPPLGGLKRNKIGKVIGWYKSNTEAKKFAQKNIETIGGFYVFNKKWFLENYLKIEPNIKGELPLTTGYLSLALKQKIKTGFFKIKNKQWQSINTQKDLRSAQEKYQQLNKKT